MSVRVRFAPSPTGHLHVGNVRTALYNWLFARQQSGTFILRIEDTDLERSEKRFEEQLMSDLKWLGLLWDEGVDVGGDYGPYRQTDRFDLYSDCGAQLLKAGKAYYCFCSVEELEREREAQLQAGLQPHYQGRCRAIPPEEAERRRSQGEEAVLRLKIRPGKVQFEDLVFGPLEVDCEVIGDFILLRSDGSAQYNFACVIDDATMKITHVIRGEGHISNTYRQILLYEALGFSMPKFAHLSTILGNDGSKLSKRHGATSIDEFRRQGYLPEALINYLTLLGWAPEQDGREILTPDELIREFRLDRVNRSPAIFDLDKLNWVNRNHLKKADPDRIVSLAMPYLEDAGIIPRERDAETSKWAADCVTFLINHVDKLEDLPGELERVFSFDLEAGLHSPEIQEILSQEGAREVIATFADLLDQQDDVDFEGYREAVNATKTKTGQKGKNLFHPIRVAVTAKSSGPELEKLIPLLERASRLSLPKPVMSARERVRQAKRMLT
ncbi:MAG TPA: glutamate--tRNA ligase [Acidobacteriota bacterium]|nr:glutamate--tRNA ligase [Acidobacteriota bacterium]